MVLPAAKVFRPSVGPSTPWTPTEIAGRLVEISSSKASAAFSIAFALIRDVQKLGEPVGWVTSSESFFYPPDAAQVGVDLSALVVVRLADAESIARAGEKLLRCGGFGLVVLDLRSVSIPMPLQTRLTGLAHRHHAALVCLSEKDSAAFSLSSLVSLRIHAEKKRTADNRFVCALRVLKDKRSGATWGYEDFYTGPAGLC